MSSVMPAPQPLLERGEAARRTGLHGPPGDAERVRDLRLAQLRPVTEHQHLALPPRQGAQRLDDLPLLLGEEDGEIRRRRVLELDALQMAPRHPTAPVQGAGP